MNKKLLIIAGIAILFLALFFFTQTKQFNQSTTAAVSPNILYFTSPVTAFSGTVDSVSGNVITVSRMITLSQTNYPQPGSKPAVNPSPQPTQVTKKITFRVKITSNAIINLPPAMINYLFLTPTPAPAPKLTISDIKAGQTVTITSTTDLRTNTSGIITAAAILLNEATAVNGKITAVTGNVLTVKGTAFLLAPPPDPLALPGISKEATYTVNVTGNTEISRYKPIAAMPTPGQVPPLPEKEKLSLADLKPGIQVTVYTDQDVTATQNLTALRIEPIIQTTPTPLPTAMTAPASGAAGPK